MYVFGIIAQISDFYPKYVTRYFQLRHEELKQTWVSNSNPLTAQSHSL
jgi:hypothetical protein